jgi:hypothetical protein
MIAPCPVNLVLGVTLPVASGLAAAPLWPSMPPMAAFAGGGERGCPFASPPPSYTATLAKI